MLRIDLRNLILLTFYDILLARGEFMKNNPMMKYAEELAIDIEKLCKSLEKTGNSNAIFQIRKSSSSVLRIFQKRSIHKACLICSLNLKLPVKNVLKLKAG